MGTWLDEPGFYADGAAIWLDGDRIAGVHRHAAEDEWVWWVCKTCGEATTKADALVQANAVMAKMGLTQSAAPAEAPPPEDRDDPLELHE